MVAVHTPNDMTLLAGFPQLSAAIERSGYDGLWVGEVNGIDAVTAATLVATATEHADIGVVLNTFTRAPSTLAMTAASLRRSWARGCTSCWAWPPRCWWSAGRGSPTCDCTSDCAMSCGSCAGPRGWSGHR